MRNFEIPVGYKPPDPCTVHLGRGARDRLLDDLADPSRGQGTILVSDSQVAPLYGEPLLRTLTEKGVAAELLTFPAGEASKNRETKSRLEDSIARAGLGRDGRIVAIGGGVTCDLAGFVAACWHRGVRLYQVPTSLLAMVDASVGGKTGVDLPGAKNQVGAFHVPCGVYIDPACLDTLSTPHYIQGLAEVVKYGVIADAGLFHRLEDSVADLQARNPELLEEIIATCVGIKGEVVRQDFLDTGPRAILNFGHTVGHAIEAAAGFKVSHGEAVAIGMVAEAGMTSNFPVQDLKRLRKLLLALGLPDRMPDSVDPGEVFLAARADKKNQDGGLFCSLPERIGRMPAGQHPAVAVPDAVFKAGLLFD
jgi:3-dehydroquinate synthase